MTTKQTPRTARVGDWVEARGLPGQASRRGQVVEQLGSAGHEHYLVRWDERHVSILYPTDGVVIVPRPKAGRTT